MFLVCKLQKTMYQTIIYTLYGYWSTVRIYLIIFELQIHSSLHGIFYRLNVKHCWKVENFVIWKNLDYGIYAWPDKSIVIENTVLVDNKVSIYAGVVGPHPLTHRTRDDIVTVKNSLMIGKSSNFDCLNDNIVPWHAAQTGKRSTRPPGGMYIIMLLA